MSIPRYVILVMSIPRYISSSLCPFLDIGHSLYEYSLIYKKMAPNLQHLLNSISVYLTEFKGGVSI